MKQPQWHVDIDDVGESQDEPFRSYNMHAEGDNREELIANAMIWEVDQDGGDHEGYTIDNYCQSVYDICVAAIDEFLKENAVA